MDSLAMFPPALPGWQTSDDFELSSYLLHLPSSSSFVTLEFQQPAHESQHHSVTFDYSLGFEQDCQDTGRAIPALTAADQSPSVRETPALPAPAVAPTMQLQCNSVPVTFPATGPTGAQGAGTVAQQQHDVVGKPAAQQQQSLQEACCTATSSMKLQISPAGPCIKEETAAQPVQQQQSCVALAASAAAHHQTDVQQIKVEKLEAGNRCNVDTRRKPDLRLVISQKGEASHISSQSLPSDRPENSSSSVTSCTTATVSDDFESKCAKQQEATQAASATSLPAAAAATAADDEGGDVKPKSSSGYSQQAFWDYYIEIGVLDPEANPKMHLHLPTVFPDLELNGRIRVGKKAEKVGPLHALRKICRGLRAALGPQAEQAWRSLGLKHKDSRGDLNLSGCYSFLESVLTGQRTCPYIQSANAKAAQWSESSSSSVWGYLWPQAEELCLPGVVTYIARLVNWGSGRAPADSISPDDLNSCFNKGGNGYKAIDLNLTKLGAYLWNWPLPLSNTANDLQLFKADPPRQLLPPNRAPKGTKQNSAAGSATSGVAAPLAGRGRGGRDTSNERQQSGRKRKAASYDDDSDYDIDYEPPAATTPRTRAALKRDRCAMVATKVSEHDCGAGRT